MSRLIGLRGIMTARQQGIMLDQTLRRHASDIDQLMKRRQEVRPDFDRFQGGPSDDGSSKTAFFQLTQPLWRGQSATADRVVLALSGFTPNGDTATLTGTDGFQGYGFVDDIVQAAKVEGNSEDETSDAWFAFGSGWWVVFGQNTTTPIAKGATATRNSFDGRSITFTALDQIAASVIWAAFWDQESEIWRASGACPT